jgi:hypothetical protein
MGFSTMIQRVARVVAFVAIVSLSLHPACTLGVQPPTSTQNEPNGGGCHESVPPTPQSPDPGHVCCSGDHVSDALLTAFVTPVPLISDLGALNLTSPLRSFAASPSSADFPAFSPPHGLLALRI